MTKRQFTTSSTSSSALTLCMLSDGVSMQCVMTSRSRLKLRQGGTAQNIGLHKYFYERSEYWKEVREEASRLEPQAASGDGSTNAIANEDVNEDLQPQTSIQLGNFDNRHLSSLPIVRARIVELLSRCTNNLHSARNLLVSMVSKLGMRKGLF
jgi:hypothetical protein